MRWLLFPLLSPLAVGLAGCEGEVIETPVQLFVPELAGQLCLADNVSYVPPVDAVVVDVFTFDGSAELYAGNHSPCHRCAVAGPEGATCTRVARRCRRTAALGGAPGIEASLAGLEVPALPGDKPVCVRVTLWDRAEEAEGDDEGWVDCEAELPFEGTPEWCLTSDLGNLGAGQPLFVREAVCAFHEAAFAACGRPSTYVCPRRTPGALFLPSCAGRAGEPPPANDCAASSAFCRGAFVQCLAAGAPLSLSQCLAY